MHEVSPRTGCFVPLAVWSLRPGSAQERSDDIGAVRAPAARLAMLCAGCRGRVRPRIELRTERAVYLCIGCGTPWQEYAGASLLRLTPRVGPDADPFADLERRGGHLPLKLGRRSPWSEFRLGIRPTASRVSPPLPPLEPEQAN